jgi:hypothetical protein
MNQVEHALRRRFARTWINEWNEAHATPGQRQKVDMNVQFTKEWCSEHYHWKQEFKAQHGRRPTLAESMAMWRELEKPHRKDAFRVFVRDVHPMRNAFIKNKLREYIDAHELAV